MRTPLIIANWKMNHTIEETIQFITIFSRKWVASNQIEIVLCPPFTALYSLSVVLSEGTPAIKLGAQNCHWEKSGPYTGEVSPLFLRETGCSYVLVGHSERRQYFLETDEIIHKKIQSVLDNELSPVLCVGENREQRTQGVTMEVIRRQLEGLCQDKHHRLSALAIAYEPVWAIGTGLNATPEQAQEVHAFIRQWLHENLGQGMAQSTRLLYGGSVNPENAALLMKKPDVDGVLVGGASLRVDSFLEIVNYQER